MSVNRRLFVAGLAAVPAALAAACGAGSAAGGSSGGAGSGPRLKISVVVHDDPNGSFWNVVTRGANDAGKVLGLDVNVQGNTDASKQSQYIDAAVASKVDGLAVSLANPDALSTSVRNAVSAGIPVVTLNSGVDAWQRLGALTHVGQTETLAGQGAGKRLQAAGVTKLLTIIHEVGNIGLEQRASGAEQSFPNHTRVQVDLHNLPDAQAKIKSALAADTSVDGVLALNPDIGNAAMLAIQSLNASGRVKLGTFDLSPQVISAVGNGQILFAVDQQQYLQGYLPVQFLQLYKTNLNIVGGGQPVLTGPSFVTKDNAARVLQLVKAGTR
jgi:simple sugar transport system substrate-binding protein